MAGPENINDHNENIRQMQSELETLRSKGSHAGSSYDRHIGDRIAYLKAQIHVVTLKRNEEIRKSYKRSTNKE